MPSPSHISYPHQSATFIREEGREVCFMGVFPTLEEFLAAPIEDVRDVAPTTIVLGVGGTRRRAVLAGLSLRSDEYAAWTREQMIACLDILFRHGVQHIFTTPLIQAQWHEVTQGYREKLLAWIDWGIAGPEALADYAHRGWQIRLCGTAKLPELHAASLRLEESTGSRGSPAVWFSVTPDVEDAWASIFEVCRSHSVTTRAEAIQAAYGQNIPPATMFIGSGKPTFTVDIVPPLLIGNLQCYWRQHLGYDLDEQTVRTIFYDYAYLRRTWNDDKSGRAEQILQHQEAWENPPVLGVGKKLGPFWFPQ